MSSTRGVSSDWVIFMVSGDFFDGEIFFVGVNSSVKGAFLVSGISSDGAVFLAGVTFFAGAISSGGLILMVGGVFLVMAFFVGSDSSVGAAFWVAASPSVAPPF